MKRGNPYQDIIDLDSQSQQPHTQPPASQSLQKSLLELTRQKNMSKSKERKQSIKVKYEDVCLFQSIKWTSNLDRHYLALKQFLQKSSKNILFIFGPSGCGKTLMVEKALSINSISYEFATPRQQETEQGQIIYQDIFSLVEEALYQKKTSVSLFKEYPLATSQCGSEYLSKYKIFRESIYRQIQKTDRNNKIIFILNSQIYSPFYTLHENSDTRSLTTLSNLDTIKMEAYGLREMKGIIDHFITENHLYSSTVNTPNMLDQVVTEANGDARKALHLIYHRKMNQLARELTVYDVNDWNSQSMTFGQRDKTVAELKEDQKVNVFHMLGKFLYGKRKKLDTTACSNRGRKQDKQISEYYTSEELARYDPPFYFKPAQLFDRSQLSLATFSELLFQNFINRYGNIKDISKMQQIFTKYDSYNSNALNRYELMNEMEQLMKQLHTWGILIYNKHTLRQKKMYRMQRSKNNSIRQLIKKKIDVVKSYYSQRDDGGRYRTRDVILFAHLTKDSRYKYEFHPLHLHLLQLLTDCRKSAFQPQVDHQVSVIQDENEDVSGDSCSRVNAIEQSIMKELTKRQRFLTLMEDSDSSDIDSDIEK